MQNSGGNKIAALDAEEWVGVKKVLGNSGSKQVFSTQIFYLSSARDMFITSFLMNKKSSPVQLFQR